jgi:hypothetical protein
MSFTRAASQNLPSGQAPSNRFQTECDLSDLLTMGRAVLIAQVEEADASRLVRTQEDGAATPLGMDDDQKWVIYRFVLPVTPLR